MAHGRDSFANGRVESGETRGERVKKREEKRGGRPGIRAKRLAPGAQVSVKPDVIACLVGKYYSNCISLAGCAF